MKEYYIDLILILTILLVPTIASVKVRVTYAKYHKKQNKNNLTGFDVARRILDENGLDHIMIVETRGTMSDHYDPKRKVVRLSKDVFHGETVAAEAIAAHEVGHAIQDKDGNAFMRLRSFFVPVVNVCSSVSYIIILLGFLTQILDFIYAGVFLMGAGLLFQIITLPVEFGASKKAKEMLITYDLITKAEKDGVSSMLSSAAMTYVAGTLAVALQMLRLILMANNRRR